MIISFVTYLHEIIGKKAEKYIKDINLLTLGITVKPISLEKNA